MFTSHRKMNFFDFAKVSTERQINPFATSSQMFDTKQHVQEPKKATFTAPFLPQERKQVAAQENTVEDVDTMLAHLETQGQDLKNQLHVQMELIKLLGNQVDAFLTEAEDFISSKRSTF